MKFKRTALAIVAGTAMATAGFASASVLHVNGGTIQYGQSGVTCDTDGVKVHYGYDDKDNLIHSVRVTGISQKCLGADIGGMFDGNSSTRFGFRQITQDDIDNATGAVLKFTGAKPDAQSVNTVKIWIEG